MYCSKCGKEVAAADAFCLNCGSQIAAQPQPVKRGRNPLVIVLAILVGLMLLGFLSVLLIIGSVAIPNLRRAQVRAAEYNAIQSVRMIQTAEATYQAQSGQYAGSLVQL